MDEKEFEDKALKEQASASVLESWSREADAAFRKLRDGKKTIAIVGFSPTSRHLAPMDDDRVEIWGVNEAHRHRTSYMKRWDRWFQIHKRWDFTKTGTAAAKEHWEWLQQDHGHPIYMQEVHPDIPSSVELPMDEIRARFPGPKELLPTGEEAERFYMTSTFAYMCAMAMLVIEEHRPEGWKLDDPPYGRIEVYGFDMATFTEFQYQKGSTEFWIGYARGRGIEVTVPYKSRLLAGKLYGYEVSRVIGKSHIQSVLEEILPKKEALLKEVRDVSEQRKFLESGNKLKEAQVLFQKEIELARDLNVEWGRVQELEDLIRYIEAASKGDEEILINRQLLEFRWGLINKERAEALQTLHVARGRRSMKQEDIIPVLQGKELEDTERDKLEKTGQETFQAEFDAASMVNALHGRQKILAEFIRYLDNQDPDDQLVAAVMNADPLKKAEGE